LTFATRSSRNFASRSDANFGFESDNYKGKVGTASAVMSLLHTSLSLVLESRLRPRAAPDIDCMTGLTLDSGLDLKGPAHER
jgi:hypothetical protein